jgi:hypothetical protein
MFGTYYWYAGCETPIGGVDEPAVLTLRCLSKLSKVFLRFKVHTHQSSFFEIQSIGCRLKKEG